MKSIIKKIFLFFIFLMIILTIYIHLCYLFRNTGWSRYDITLFYEEPEDSLDVVLIGGSNVFRYWNPMFAYREQGFASYNYAVEYGVPLLEEAVKDICRYQEPRLFVVDMRCFLSHYWEGTINTGLKNQLGSQDIHWLERLGSVAGYKSAESVGIRTAASVYLDLPIYHNNYTALSDKAHWLFSDDNGNGIEMSSYGSSKGFVVFADTYKHAFYFDDMVSRLSAERSPMLPAAEQIYRQFLAYCRNHQLDVLLVESPFVFTEQDMAESNRMADIAAEYGFTFLNTNYHLDEIGVDYEVDFSDPSHMNILGAEKYTSFMADYLKDNYNLPDHRGSTDYAGWDELAQKMDVSSQDSRQQMIEMINAKKRTLQNEEIMKTSNDPLEWLTYAEDPNLTLLIAGDHLSEAGLKAEMKLALRNFGIFGGAFEENENFIGVYSGKVLYTATPETDYSYIVPSPNNITEPVKCDFSVEKTIDISVNNEKYCLRPGRNLIFIAIDNNTAKTVDAIWLAINSEGEVELSR